MSRRHRAAGDAGTDSFLDVLANLVGILVVLVVMTALKAAVPPPAPPPPDPPAVAVAPLMKRVPLVAPKPRVIYEVAPPPPVPEALRAELAAAEAGLSEGAVRLASLREDAERAGREAAAVRPASAEARRELAAARDRLAAAEAAARTAAERAEAARLDRDLWAVRANAAADKPPTPLEHTALPVGRRVVGTEVHFRLTGSRTDAAGGTVRVVPIEALTARLERDVTANRDRIAARGSYRGSVGPVHGYAMNYRIEREGGGSRAAAGTVVRYRLAGWTLEDVDPTAAVPVAAALANGSNFRQVLAVAGPGAAATFWVSPEAFGAFRTLRAAAREAGLRIAARPLPAGVPITGSPDGTASVAQ